MQLEAPLLPCDVPAPQLVQLVAAKVENCPATQVRQPDEPVFAWYWPPVHDPQLALPPAAAEPVAQLAQEVAIAAEYVPAAQLEQREAPLEAA